MTEACLRIRAYTVPTTEREWDVEQMLLDAMAGDRDALRMLMGRFAADTPGIEISWEKCPE